MMVDVARWPGFSFNARSVAVYRRAMYKDTMRGLYSSLGGEVDV
jgi:hypothetical protein